MDGIWPAEGLLTKLSTFLDSAPISKTSRAGIVILEYVCGTSLHVTVLMCNSWNNDPATVTMKLLEPWLVSDKPLRLQTVSA